MSLTKNEIVDELKIVVASLDEMMSKSKNIHDSRIQKIAALRDDVSKYQSVLEIGSYKEYNYAALAVITRELQELRDKVEYTRSGIEKSGIPLNQSNPSITEKHITRPGVIATRYNLEKHARRDWNEGVVSQLQTISKTLSNLADTTNQMVKDWQEKALAESLGKPVVRLGGG